MENNSGKAVAGLGAVLFALLILFGMIAVMGIVVAWLWNYFMPGLLDVPFMDMWEGMAMYALANILFKSSVKVETVKEKIKNKSIN